MMCLKRTLAFLLLIPFIAACVSHDLNGPVVDCSAVGPDLELGIVTNATSCSSPDGAIHVTASGGKQPYTYLLDGRNYSSENFTNLTPGIYSVGVRDARGCDTVITNVEVEALGFSFQATVEPDSLCLGNDGSILIEVLEGNPPYTYKIGSGAFGDENKFIALSKGSYDVEIKDKDGCPTSLNITVPHGYTATSWEDDIKPIIEEYCATTGCHNGVSREDLRIYEKAKLYATQIKDNTGDRSMPFDGPSLTQSQIDLIACWVDDGAPKN